VVNVTSNVLRAKKLLNVTCVACRCMQIVKVLQGAVHVQ